MRRKSIAILFLPVILAAAVSCEKARPSAVSSVNVRELEAATPDERLKMPYDKPVTINIVLGYRPSENPKAPENLTPETATAVKKLKEKLNIEIKYRWIVNADQFTAKFGAELAAGNLPDIMFLLPSQFEDLYEQGAFADLTETYELYANDAIKEVVNFDGKMLNSGIRDDKLYGLPNGTYPGQLTSQVYYRMDLLKKYGINGYDDLPATIAEFETLADKLLADNGGRPILTANKNFIDHGLSDFSPVFHAYEAWPSNQAWADSGNGTLEYTGIHPNVKEAVTKLNEWYKKGYFPKDFAAMDVWGADTPSVNDIVAGKCAIVFGSWWIPNWPLNMNVANQPEAEWVVGPPLTKDGTRPKIQVARYPIDNFVAVSRNFKNPEALFKMMNWAVEYSRTINRPDFDTTATPEELIEKDSHVYVWLPFRVYSPSTLIDNYLFFNNLEKQGIYTADKIDLTGAPTNEEFPGVLRHYIAYHEGPKGDPAAWSATWGSYTSRVFDRGGVAQMYNLYTTSEIQYNELYVTTPTMITKQSQLQDYKNSQLISMIMGDVPIGDFEKFVNEWNKLGGNEIRKEVNEWYSTIK